MMLVTTLYDLRHAVNQACESKHIAVDVETTGLDYIDSEVIGVGFAIKDASWYVDIPTLAFIMETNTRDDVDPIHKGEAVAYMWDILLPMLDLTQHTLISHNAPFDMYFLAREVQSYLNIDILAPKNNWWDTLGMAALADENLIGVKVPLEGEEEVVRSVGALSLKALSHIFLGRKQRLWDENFEAWSVEERAEYGEADVRNTYDLAILFTRYFQKEGLLPYYLEFVAPMSFVTVEMETHGFLVDTTALLTVADELRQSIQERYQACVEMMPKQKKKHIVLGLYKGDDLEERLMLLISQTKKPENYLTEKGNPSKAKAKLYKLMAETEDSPFWEWVIEYRYTPSNPNSYQQLAAYLMDKGYNLPTTPAGNYSVAEGVLKVLARQNPDDPFWQPLFEMRKLEKLNGTYVTALLDMAWEDDTVHPEWNQAGTVTGRYSTSTSNENKNMRHKRGPALQTIPRPDTLLDEGWPYNPREWFIAHPGNALCVADLSQAEVRMLAVMSQDPRLIDTIRGGGDLHTENAIKVYGRAFTNANAVEQHTMRNGVKYVTFGTMYGIGAGKLSERLNCSWEEAAELLSNFYETFTRVPEWKREETDRLLRYGYVETLYGRRRSPILVQDPPRVGAKPGSEMYEFQKMRERLWMAEFDYAMAKSGFDETTDIGELDGRAARQAINFEIQGSVAEMINAGLREIVRAGYSLCGQIHDEVIIELPDTPEDREKVTNLLTSLFNVEIKQVPFVIDIHFGPSWAAGKE